MIAAAPTVMPVRDGRRLRRRHLWLVPGLAVAFYANAEAQRYGLGIAPLVVFGIIPHLTVLAGFGQPTAPGRLASRAVPIFNVAHHPLIPLTALAVYSTGLVPPIALIGGLVWLSHIVVDWALGDGIRRRDGSRPGPRSLIATIAG